MLHCPAALEADVRAFLDAHNKDPKPFVWTKTADQILESLKRYCGKAGALRAERARRASK